MNRILVLLVVFSLGFNKAYSQKSLNDYKYIIVPTKYDFLNEADKFQLNSLTKFLFNKHGFTAFMGDEAFPRDLQNNNCLALRANVSKGRGLLTTKLGVELKDCNNTIVYKTDIGESRKKEFKTAYNLALRDAFKSFQTANYAYSRANSGVVMAESKSPQSESKSPEPIPTKPQPKPKQPKIAKPKTVKVERPLKEVKKSTNILYAQAIDGGFQIVDSTPKVIYKIASSGIKEVYIVLGKDAIIHQLDGVWVISEVRGKDLLVKGLDIKF